MNVPLWIALPVTGVTALAVVADARTRRIPNSITGPALLLGLVTHLAMRGSPGFSDSMLGLLVAGGLLLPGWLMGWMGAGDVKLMAAVGAWLGWSQGLVAVLASLIAGGVIALGVAARRGVLKRSIWGAALLGSSVLSGGIRSGAPAMTTGVRFPFAGAVLTGSLIALWAHL